MANWKYAIFVAALGCCAAAIQAQPTYPLKEAFSRTGTQIQAEILRSPIPFDKSYEELSAEQLGVLRSKYSHLGDNEEPPFPEGGMASIGREIAKLPHKVLTQGFIVITVRVDEKGEGQSASIYKTPDDGLAKSIAAIVVKAKYKPAKCAGAPCAMDFPFIFEVGAGN